MAGAAVTPRRRRKGRFRSDGGRPRPRAEGLPWGRWLLLGLLGAMTLWLQWRLWAGPDGVPQVLELRRAIEAQRQRNAELAERNRALAAEVRDLKHGLTAVEERARQELGMIRRDETFFRIVPREEPVRQ